MTRNDAASGKTEDPSDAVLVQDFLGGRIEAFEEIVRRYQKMAYYAAIRIVGNHDDADDVVQKTLISAYQNLGKFRGESSLKTWLFRIVMNYSKNRIRDRARHMGEEIDERDASMPPAVEESMERTDRLRILDQAVATLPPRQKEVLLLRIQQELSFAEISETVGCSITAAKVNYHHAVKALHSRVSNQRETDETEGNRR